jgi:hypothetical protein
MTKYIVRAALHDETNEGWVWTTDHHSRNVVCIVRPDNKRKVYCIVRKIDDNFLDTYNQTPDERKALKALGKKCRINIDLKNEHPTIVMGQWYRDALGGFATTNKDNGNRLVELEINHPCRWISWWSSLRASAHHPDIAVRIGVSLGAVGVILGAIALIPTLLDIFAISKSCQWLVTLAAALMSILLGYCACRRPPPPQ